MYPKPPPAGVCSLALAAAIACASPPPPAGTDPPEPPPVPDAIAFRSGPELVPNTQGARLVQWLHAETSVPTTLTLSLDDGQRAKTLELGPASELHEHMVLGLHADTAYAVSVTARDAEGNEVSVEGPSFTTGRLPQALREPLYIVEHRPEEMEPGVTMLGAADHILAIDSHGEIVWYMPWAQGAVEVNRTDDVPLLVLGDRTKLYELDMTGQVLRAYCPTQTCSGGPLEVPVDVPVLHHDVVKLPNGNYLSLSVERQPVLAYPTSELDPLAPTAPAVVASPVVVEFDRAGTVVREHSLLHTLDPTRIGRYSVTSEYWTAWYGSEARDWGHANSLWYDAARDEVVVSLRHQDAVIGIDRVSGALHWILAPELNWKEPEHLDARVQPTTPLAWSYKQHSAELTSRDTLLVFDNGNMRASAFEEELPESLRYSRAVEFAIDREAGTVERVWSYGGSMRPWHLAIQRGDADELPQTGNILIAFTSGASQEYPPIRLVEVTRTDPAKVVFDAYLPVSMWALRRAQRLPSLYP